MPHYHFNVLDGAAYIDKTGIELAGIDDAKREARRYAGMRNYPRGAELG